MDRVELKGGILSYACICVEVEMERGLPNDITMNLENWNHTQILDYDQLLLNCKKIMNMDILPRVANSINKQLEGTINRKYGIM